MVGRTRRAGAVATATAVAGAALVATSADGSRAADAPAAGPASFVAVAVQSIRLNVGPPEPSPGDRVVFSHTLTSADKTVGLSGAECILTSVTTAKAKGKKPARASARSQCMVTVALQDGQIAAQGLTDLIEPGGPFEVVITGGTGAYTGATGTVTKTGGAKKGRLTLSLTPAAPDAS